MSTEDRARVTLAESARTATRHRVAVRAAVAVCLLLLSLLAGCAHASDSALQPTDPTPSVSDSSPSVGPSADIAADTAIVTAGSPPSRIEIAAIGVGSDVMDLGLQPDGTMEVPAGGFPAGWYTGSPAPGQVGPSIVAGHVDWGGSAGVFYRLRELQKGDDVTVTAEDGSSVRFVVSKVGQYPKDAFPTSEVYGDIDHPGLRLITCGGQFDSDLSSYDDNIVVYADRV